jgi:hypothetical protein
MTVSYKQSIQRYKKSLAAVLAQSLKHSRMGENELQFEFVTLQGDKMGRNRKKCKTNINLKENKQTDIKWIDRLSLCAFANLGATNFSQMK